MLKIKISLTPLLACTYVRPKRQLPFRFFSESLWWFPRIRERYLMSYIWNLYRDF